MEAKKSIIARGSQAIFFAAIAVALFASFAIAPEAYAGLTIGTKADSSEPTSTWTFKQPNGETTALDTASSLFSNEANVPYQNGGTLILNEDTDQTVELNFPSSWGVLKFVIDLNGHTVGPIQLTGSADVELKSSEQAVVIADGTKEFGIKDSLSGNLSISNVLVRCDADKYQNTKLTGVEVNTPGGQIHELNNVTVDIVANNAQTMNGVTGSGNFKMENCSVSVDQQGAGNLYGITNRQNYIVSLSKVDVQVSGAKPVGVRAAKSGDEYGMTLDSCSVVALATGQVAPIAATLPNNTNAGNMKLTNCALVAKFAEGTDAINATYAVMGQAKATATFCLDGICSLSSQGEAEIYLEKPLLLGKDFALKDSSSVRVNGAATLATTAFATLGEGADALAMPSFTGVGNYADKVSVPSEDGASLVWADKKAFAEENVSGIEASYQATGAQLKPVPAVTVEGTALVENADYVVSYGENLASGSTGTVTITGKGLYVGSEVVKTFEITKSEQELADEAAAAEVAGLIDALVSADNATADTKAAADAAKAKYDALSDEAKALLSDEAKQKLAAVVAAADKAYADKKAAEEKAAADKKAAEEKAAADKKAAAEEAAAKKAATPGQVKLTKKTKSTKKGKVTVAWKKVKGAKGYQVKVGKKVYTVKSAKTVKKTYKAAKGKKVKVKVRAFGVYKGKRLYGKWSKAKTVMVKG